MKPRSYIFMPWGCLYLNNSGSRWITNNMRFILILPDGTRKIRRADYYFSFGNFGGLSYRYKGKRFSILPNERDEETNLEVVYHKE